MEASCRSISASEASDGGQAPPVHSASVANTALASLTIDTCALAAAPAPCAVAAQDRGDDGVVLVPGFRQPARQPELRAPERRQPAARHRRRARRCACCGRRDRAACGTRCCAPRSPPRRRDGPAAPKPGARARARAARRPSCARPRSVRRSPSSSAMLSNIDGRCSCVTTATMAPRLGRLSTRPMAPSWPSASRTGVRDTSKRAASDTSSSLSPGRSDAGDDAVGDRPHHLVDRRSRPDQVFRFAHISSCVRRSSLQRPAMSLPTRTDPARHRTVRMPII